MSSQVPLSQWIQNVRFELHKLFTGCDGSVAFLHKYKFANLAGHLYPNSTGLENLKYKNPIPTQEETDLFRRLVRAFSEAQAAIVKFKRESHVQTLLTTKSEWIYQQIDTFQGAFCSLTSSLHLLEAHELSQESQQFANDNLVDIDDAIKAIRSLRAEQSDLREDERTNLNHRIHELNILKADQQEKLRSRNEHPVPQSEFESRLKQFDRWLLDSSNYEQGKHIGEGVSSKVYCACSQATGQSFAIKIFQSQTFTPRQFEQLCRELEVSSTIRHPCILQFVGFWLVPNFSIVTPFMSGGSLFHRLHSRGRQLNPTERTIIALGIAEGMEYLHSKRLIHRDLKSLNVLLDENHHPKIADFGLSRTWGDSIMTQNVGTKRWMALEVVRGESYDEKADVYSFGIVLWELLTGCIPFEDLSDFQMTMKVTMEEWRPHLPATCPQKLGTLIRNCWNSNPTNRPAFKMISEMFRKGEVKFDGADRRRVDDYSRFIRDNAPQEESFVEILERLGFETFRIQYGNESIVSIAMGLIEDGIFGTLSGLFDSMMTQGDDCSQYFLKSHGVERFLGKISESDFVWSIDSIDYLIKMSKFAQFPVDETLVSQLTNFLVSVTVQQKQRCVTFFTMICTEQHTLLFCPIIPELFKHTKNQPVFLIDLLKLFQKMLQFDELCLELNKHSAAFCELLQHPLMNVQVILLDILKTFLSVYSPSNDLISSFLSQLSLLIQRPQLHQSIIYVLTQLINYQQTFAAIAKMRQETPLTNLFTADRVIVCQSLKIFFLMLSNHLTADSVQLNKLQPLLMAKDLRIAKLAAMCLTVAPGFVQGMTDHVSSFFNRAFEAENELTMDAMRLAGIISQTFEGRARLSEVMPRIVGFLRSENVRLKKLTILVIASISSIDQLSESLVSAVPSAMELLDSNDTVEPALAFVTNISVNCEAAVLAAERLEKLVEMFQNGDVRTLAAIQRIVTLPDCFQYFLPCLRDFVESGKKLIPTGIGSVLIEIFDAVVQYPEGKGRCTTPALLTS
jgi:serine/threonine protein kinase